MDLNRPLNKATKENDDLIYNYIRLRYRIFAYLEDNKITLEKLLNNKQDYMSNSDITLFNKFYDT
ncbi:hypothetical protein SAMN05421540_1185 [Psychroflexus halocasei]|uniref:Uncharacterized protein n=1 Tax=Psychroflexus halocasei TaxID=908615 RepID=A0A1H4DYJ4_9FLAO|nr:hypothetical protein SAMN05421540_1185 [Psychroflexus halocasei]